VLGHCLEYDHDNKVLMEFIWAIKNKQSDLRCGPTDYGYRS